MAGPDTTATRHYPRPDPEHSARADAVRIAQAFDQVDADVTTLTGAIATLTATTAALAAAIDDAETLALALE